MSAIIEVKNLTKKYGALTVPLILLFLCASMVFAPALAQLHFHPCPVKFDKDSYRPGETVTMYGTVTDGGKPVEGAKVVVDVKAFGLGSLEAKTDSNGNWTVSFEVSDDQELGTWPVEVSVAYGAGSMTYTLMIQIGEVEKEDDVETVENEVESLKTQIAELEAINQEMESENQMLQVRIQELEEEIQRLQETSSGVSYGTLGIVVSGVVVICLAVFAIMYHRSSQRRTRKKFEVIE